MNYEQMYKEALERAKNGKPIDEIFPELKESEDECIRKSIIGFLTTISSLKDGRTVSNEDFDSKALLEWAAWLEKQDSQTIKEALRTEYEKGRADAIVEFEKQGEQKPANITDDWIEDYWQHEKVNNPDSYDKGEEIQFDHQGFVNFCRKYCQKSAEWSEEDNYMFNRVLMTLSGFSYFGGMEASYVIDWLKSLKPQPHWKPSDEQMRALRHCCDGWQDNADGRLESLYDDLQKL